MKLICDGLDLAEAVATVGRATSARAINPILEGIKLTAKNGTLTLAATDLEMYIQKTIRADISAEGVTVVPGKLFAEYVGKLGKSSVGLHLDGDNMKITHGENVGNFQCLLLVEYPDIINITKKPHFTIKSDALRDLITKTRIAVSTDDSRPILKGVLCEIGKDKITGVSLDGFRLSKIEKEIKNHDKETKVIIPAKCLDEIKKLVADDNGEVSIIIDNKFLQVNINKTTFAGRLIDGEFINYTQIIPQKFESSVVVERTAFDSAVERAGLLVRSDRVNLVTLNITDKFITVTSNNEIGRISEKVGASLNGKDTKISFNAKYLYDVMRASSDEFVKINFSGELSPCTIESAKPCDYLFLVLPVRLS
jgi:DNA polymerase-3 subunit beta